MFTRKLPLWIFASLLVLALSACFPTPQGSQDPQEMIETAAYATVSAQQTQIAFDSLVLELTRIAQVRPARRRPHTNAPVENTAQPDQPTATASPTVFVPSITPLPPTPTQLPPTPTPIPCLAAQFISDVNVPDGT
jgi:hypothetical protein